MQMVIIFCAFYVFLCEVEAQIIACNSTNETQRHCIPIKDCQPLLTILKNPRRTKEDIALLRKSHCSFYGDIAAVCCPRTDSCYTPDGRLGKCDGLKSCRNLQRLLLLPLESYKIQYVQISKCDGSDQYSVCCGPVPDLKPIQKGRCAFEGSAFPPDSATQCCGVDSSISNKIFAILLGEYDTSNDGPDCTPVEEGGTDCTEGVISIPIEQTISHPGFNATLRKHDIALIRMTQAAPFTDFVRPICLPRQNITRKTTPLKFTVAGWGGDVVAALASTTKLHVKLPYVNRSRCQQLLANSTVYRYDTKFRTDIVNIVKSHICAGGEHGKDACFGDHGGPLMYENDGIYEVVGLVSYGLVPCAQKDIPGIYTNVYEYNPWIRSNIVP